jgi:hypothetical protein
MRVGIKGSKQFVPLILERRANCPVEKNPILSVNVKVGELSD